MAFSSDVKFVKARMSDAVKFILLDGLDPMGDWSEFVYNLSVSHWKVSLSWVETSSAWVVSATTTKAHKFPMVCVSCWSGTLEGAFEKLYANLSLIPDYAHNPLLIDEEIRKTEEYVGALVRENISKLKVK